MLQKTDAFVKKLHSFFDISLTVVSFFVAYFAKTLFLPESVRGLRGDINYFELLLLIVIIWFVVFRAYKIYDSFYDKDIVQIIIELIKSILTSLVFLIAILYVFKIEGVSRILLTGFIGTNFVFLITGKIVMHHFFKNYRQNYHNILNVVIVGSKARSKEAIAMIQKSGSDYKILGCFENNRKYVGTTVSGDVKVVGVVDELVRYVTDNVVDEVVFTMSLKEIEFIDIYMLLIELVGVKVRIFPDWQIHSLEYNPGIAAIRYETFCGHPTMLISGTAIANHHVLIKTIIDYVMGFFICLAALPIFIVVPLLIKIASPGPVFFKQQRVGLNGRSFTLYKFRTMVVNAEEKLKELTAMNEMDGPVFKIKRDPRIIPLIGTILRKTSIDEIPQIINVLRGEMSFVGPRPPLFHEVEKYQLWQRRRMAMKPGITCLWQISESRNDLTFNEWMCLDLEYIDKWSLRLDFSIILRTVLVVFRASGR